MRDGKFLSFVIGIFIGIGLLGWLFMLLEDLAERNCAARNKVFQCEKHVEWEPAK